MSLPQHPDTFLLNEFIYRLMYRIGMSKKEGFGVGRKGRRIL